MYFYYIFFILFNFYIRDGNMNIKESLFYLNCEKENYLYNLNDLEYNRIMRISGMKVLILLIHFEKDFILFLIVTCLALLKSFLCRFVVPIPSYIC